MQWIKQFGSNESETVTAIARRPMDGWIFVAGYTNGRIGHYSLGGYDSFIAAVDSDGYLMWTRQLGTEGNDFAQAIAFDSSHMLYAVGMTTMVSNANDGTGGTGAITTNKGEVDAFVSKIDSVIEILRAVTLKPTPAPTPAPTMFVDATCVALLGPTTPFLPERGSCPSLSLFLLSLLSLSLSLSLSLAVSLSLPPSRPPSILAIWVGLRIRLRCACHTPVIHHTPT